MGVLQASAAGQRGTARPHEKIVTHPSHPRPHALGASIPRPPSGMHPGIQRQKDVAQLASISLIGQQGLKLLGKPIVATEPGKPVTIAVTPSEALSKDRWHDTTRQQRRPFVKVWLNFKFLYTAVVAGLYCKL